MSTPFFRQRSLWDTGKAKRTRQGGRKHRNKQREYAAETGEEYGEENTSDATQLVVNISSKTLTEVQLNTLAKGLLFCPLSNINWFQFDLDLCNFFLRLRLKTFYSTSTSEGDHTKLVVSSGFQLKQFGLYN